MRIDTTGQTDGATIAIFWPETLPSDAVDRMSNHPEQFLADMKSQGRMISLPCSADGFYNLALFVNEDLPPNLQAVCNNGETYPTLTVQGPGWFGGAEYIRPTNEAVARDGSSSVERIDLPPGSYRATVWDTSDASDALYESITKSITPETHRIVRIHNVLWIAFSLGFITLWVCVLARWTIPTLVLLIACILVYSAAAVIRRTDRYQAKSKAYEPLATSFPDYIVKLESLS